MVGDKVNSATIEFGPLLVIRPVAIGLYRGVVVVLCAIDVTTERAHPLLAVLEPPDERIDVCSAVLAADDWFGLEIDMWYLWAFSIFSLYLLKMLISQKDI